MQLKLSPQCIEGDAGDNACDSRVGFLCILPRSLQVIQYVPVGLSVQSVINVYVAVFSENLNT